MFSPFERMVALRYLRPSRKEGAVSITAGLSFLGVLLGVAALIIVMSVMNGFRAELLKSILGFNGHIGVVSLSRTGIDDFNDRLKTIRQFPDVVQATALIERQTMVTAHGVANGVLVHGIAQADLEKRELIATHIIRGTLKTFDHGNSVVLGKRLAEKMNLYPGDQVTLLTPDGTPTAFGFVPKMRSFTVTALFEVGMKDYDNNVIFIPLKEAQTFFQYPQAVNGIEIFVKDPEQVSATRARLKEAYPDLHLIDWQQANAKFFNSLKVERNAMFVILTLIILVAALNIISSLIMLVKTKTQDIAILRTMGASRQSILKIFFLTGSLVGTSGIAVGTLLGLLFSYNIEKIRRLVERLAGTDVFNPDVYFLSKLPSKVDLIQVGWITGMALLLVFAASLIPAWRAARLDPVEALRYA